MIRLNLDPQPFWLEIAPGLRFRVAPVSTALISAARREPVVADLDPEGRPDLAALAMAKAIGAVAILEWEGIADEQGRPLAPTRETVSAVMDIYPVFEAFQLRYVAKGLLLESEKNGSALSPTGTSAGAIGTAQPVPASAMPAPGD